ncbi:hypothetical protein AAHA92_31083 [Salvia divinorum]|uniref:Uncharacterized protein n=1 Tax=Salvia divinorum TaxID=28513 RepID=A0ABD1FT07_SALDI
MDFEDWSCDRGRSGGYHRLHVIKSDDAKRVKKVVRKGVKLSRSRRLNWKPFSIMLTLSRRIARFYGGFVKRMKMDEACPTIAFSYQWGIPVLSHSSSISRSRRSLPWL